MVSVILAVLDMVLEVSFWSLTTEDYVKDSNLHCFVLQKAATTTKTHLTTSIPGQRVLTGYIETVQQEVKVIWQKAPHGGPIPRLGVTPGGRKLYHWIPGVGFPISVP